MAWKFNPLKCLLSGGAEVGRRTTVWSTRWKVSRSSPGRAAASARADLSRAFAPRSRQFPGRVTAASRRAAPQARGLSPQKTCTSRAIEDAGGTPHLSVLLRRLGVSRPWSGRSRADARRFVPQSTLSLFSSTTPRVTHLSRSHDVPLAKWLPRRAPPVPSHDSSPRRHDPAKRAPAIVNISIGAAWTVRGRTKNGAPRRHALRAENCGARALPRAGLAAGVRRRHFGHVREPRRWSSPRGSRAFSTGPLAPQSCRAGPP